MNGEGKHCRNATARHDFDALAEKSINIIFLLKCTKLSLPIFSLKHAAGYGFVCTIVH